MERIVGSISPQPNSGDSQGLVISLSEALFLNVQAFRAISAEELDPLFVSIVDSLYSVLAPGALNSPPAPRTDLLPLVEYLPPIAAPGTTAGLVADLLRLNTGVAPIEPSKASRLGLLAGDGAGFPNGRRLADDVVDITLRVAVGGCISREQMRFHAHHHLQLFSK